VKGVTTVEHLVFRWSPTGYAIEVKPGDPPPAGGSIHDGAQRYLVTKVASSPLPRDTRACAYLLPVSVSRNGPDDGAHGGLVGATPVWTEPRGDLEPLVDAFPGSSCVVAVDAEGDRLGLTVDSLVGLSLDPPLVGFTVARDSPILELLPGAGGCAITILAGGQQSLADHFVEGARPIATWSGLASEPGAVGGPHFVGALGWLECSLVDTVEIGARTFVVCAVRRVEAGPEAPALVRVRGSYASV
jgi:flavin reductase (DIM6/NTAB) family NADH-FMN oxidoreductase RutF